MDQEPITYPTAQGWLAEAARRRDPQNPLRLQAADDPALRRLGFEDTLDGTMHVINLTSLKDTWSDLALVERAAMRDPQTRHLLVQNGV